MRALGVEGRIVIAFTMAGGLIVSGLSVATAAMVNSIAPGVVLSATIMLFIAGSMLGWAHAVILGYAGRAPTTDRRDVVRHILVAGLWALPAQLVALFAAAGIAFSATIVRSGSIAAWPLAILCWLVGIGVCVWAVIVGAEAISNAFVRYPEARTSSLVLVAVLAVLLVAFERVHPAIWGTDLHVRDIGAAMLAFGATFWIGAPVVVGVLHLLFTHLRKRHQLLH